MTALEKINKRCDELWELEDDWDGYGAPPVNHNPTNAVDDLMVLAEAYVQSLEQEDAKS